MKNDRNKDPSNNHSASSDDCDLERIAKAMVDKEKKQQEELEDLTPDQAEQAAIQLAQEIEEDELLAAHLTEPYDRTAEELYPLQNRNLVLEFSTGMAAQAVGSSGKAAENEERARCNPSRQDQLDLEELESCLESLFFISDHPLSKAKLKELLTPQYPTQLFEKALQALQVRYQKIHHGIELVEVAGGFQLRTKPGRAALAKKLAKVQTQRLSRGAMETLAIVAYRQPVLKEQIDKIRGVDSSHFIRTLMGKKLLQIDGRSELPGRPILYSTTSEFLQLFSLKDRSALPPLHEIEKMIPTSEALNQAEDPQLREMRTLVEQMKSDMVSTLHYDPKEDEKILREIREQVQSISTTTPSTEAQKALEKQLAEQTPYPGEQSLTGATPLSDV